MATRVPALIQLSDPRVAAQLVYIYRANRRLSRPGIYYLYLVTFPIILFLEIVCNTINNIILEAICDTLINKGYTK